MRNIVLIIGIFVASSLFAESFHLLNIMQIKEITKQLTKNQIKYENKVISAHKKETSQIRKKLKTISSLKEKDKDKILNQILKIAHDTNSAYYAKALIRETVKTKKLNVETFEKYILPPAKILKKKGMCTGYLYNGIYYQDYLKRNEEANNEYLDGMSKCKIDWIKMNMLSRVNIIKYQYGD